MNGSITTAPSPQSQYVRVTTPEGERGVAELRIGDRIMFSTGGHAHRGVVRGLGKRLAVEVAGGKIVSCHPSYNIRQLLEDRPVVVSPAKPRKGLKRRAAKPVEPRRDYVETSVAIESLEGVPQLPHSLALKASMAGWKSGAMTAAEEAEADAAIAVAKRGIHERRAEETGGRFEPDEPIVQLPPDAAREEKLASLMPLVLRCAQYYRRKCGFPAEDLGQAACLRLWKELDRFDPSRGLQLATWAQYIIRGAMLDLLRDQTYLLHGGWRTKRTEKIASLDTLKGSRGDQHNYLPFEPLDGGYSAKSHKRLEDRGLIARLLRGCSKEERLILVLYYEDGQKMKAIGEQLGLSESRVSQMHSALIDRLRATFADEEAVA